MLTPEHRRSTRTRRAPVRLVNETKSKSKSKSKSKIIESNHTEYDYEDLYGECPIAPEGFEYDREHYLASSRYAAYIDEEIAEINRKAEAKSKVDAESKVDASILSRDYVYNVHKLIYAKKSDQKYFATSLLFQSPPSSDLPPISFRRDYNQSKYSKK